jgi:hypothetical protein
MANSVTNGGLMSSNDNEFGPAAIAILGLVCAVGTALLVWKIQQGSFFFLLLVLYAPGMDCGYVHARREPYGRGHLVRSLVFVDSLRRLARLVLVGCGLSKEGDYLTPKHEFNHDVKLDVEAGVRQGVKAVLEEVLQEEMTQHLEAGYRDLTPTRRGARNGHYQRNLVTPAGQVRAL